MVLGALLALGTIFVVVGVVVVGIIGAYGFIMYNRLVNLDNRADQAKQNIDVLLKQRQDELSKLIDTAKQFMEHEQEVLTELTEAREQAERASTPKEEAAADEQVRQALGSFRARAEEYPELRSAENMQQLQTRISELEDQIADRREVYNEAVTTYNTRISQIPYVFFAGLAGHSERELFEATAAEKADVDIGAAFA